MSGEHAGGSFKRLKTGYLILAGHAVFLSEVDFHGVEPGMVLLDALAQMRFARAGFPGQPCDFCQGADAGNEHVLQLAHVGDTFAPQIGLNADDIVAGYGGVEVQHMLPVDVLETIEPEVETVAFICALREIEVESVDGTEDELVPASCSYAGVVHATPGHDYGILRELRGAHDFIPADHETTVLAEHLGTEMGEVILNLAFAGHAVLLHECLGCGAFLPLVSWYFIAANVDEGCPWKEFAHLVQDVLDKPEGEIARSHDVGEYAPAGFYPGGKAGAILVAQFRVCRYGGTGVTGNFNFRDDSDTEAVGMVHHLPYVVLGVEELHGFTICFVLFYPVGTFRAFAADFSELRVFLDFDAPALVIAEVPVQAVELVPRHDAQDTLGISYRNGVAAGVEHDASVGESGEILYLHGGKCGLTLCIGAESLGQGLRSCGQSRRTGDADADFLRSDTQLVPLGTGHVKVLNMEFSLCFFHTHGNPGGYQCPDGCLSGFCVAGGGIDADAISQEKTCLVGD